MFSVLKKKLSGKYGPVFLLIIIVCSISVLTRLFLLIYTAASFDFSFLNLTGVFLIGLFYDLCMAGYLIIPLILHIWFTNEKMYKAPWKWVVISIYLLLIGILSFFDIIPKEYNKIIPTIVVLLITVRFLIYLLLLYKGRPFRLAWRSTVLLIDFSLLVYFLFFNSVSEFFFWEEFGSRYNFIGWTIWYIQMRWRAI